MICIAEQRGSPTRATYAQIVEKYGNTKQAIVAKQQLENLRGA